MNPTLADLVPFLTDRGRVEVDLALARWQAAQLAQQLEAVQALVPQEQESE